MLNPDAPPYIPLPSMEDANKVRSTPFFQQRFERFLQSTIRDYVGTVEQLQIVLMNPPIPPTTKLATQFLAMYNQRVVIYEANKLEDPRTGYFRFL